MPLVRTSSPPSLDSDDSSLSYWLPGCCCNANSCWSIRGDLSEPAPDSRVSLDCLRRSSTSHRRKRVLQSASIDPIESSTFRPQLLWLKRVTSSISCLQFSGVCEAWRRLLITESRRSGFTDGHFCLCCRSLRLLWAAEAEIQTPGGQHLPRGPQSKYLQTHYMFISPIGHLTDSNAQRLDH